MRLSAANSEPGGVWAAWPTRADGPVQLTTAAMPTEPGASASA
ncbi:MAG TPA: hypothetical protein VFY73_15780 [Ideonella sp.]|nr:hypothetical protein [Ideonella sp.]HEX5685480.1 hypothetical protein [Ideonella sp.]